MMQLDKRISGRMGLPAVVALVVALATPARALDTDIFTGTQVDPNVLIIFDNSGSMGLQAYNTYPTTIYTGAYNSGTVYTRCRDRNGIEGGDVYSNCTCRNVQTSWQVDGSSCAASFVDNIPPPSGDDTDDRESRRKRGNRLNFETNPPKNCELAPFDTCTSDADCPGFGNSCAVQNKMAVAQGVVTALINDAANDNVRFGLMNFNPSGISYGSMNYGSSSAVTFWHDTNLNKFLFPVQDNTASGRSTLTSLIAGMTANGGTPTVHRLIDGWEYFNGEVTKSGWTSPVQYTCQRNYLLMVTDGIPEVEADYLTSPATACQFNRAKSFVGTTNGGDLNGDGKENPADLDNYIAYTGQMVNCGSDYLDDAMLKIRGMFPLGNTENQPLVLYAVSFGFDYCQPPADGDESPGGGSLLYRAAKKYGGGECLSAANPDQLDDALREALNLIKNDAQSFVAPVVPVSQTNRTESGDKLYVALFAPREGQQNWPGNIKKYGLDRNHGTICNKNAATCTIGSPEAATTADGTILGTAESYWDPSGPSGTSVTAGGVGEVLKNRSAARNIYTYTGTATGTLNVPLTASAQAFTKANSAITPAMLGLTGADETAFERDALIDYVHGYDSYDQNSDGDTTQKRSWILGDIIHSVPLIVNYGTPASPDSLIIVGANDGMLHAFDDATGEEVWAFVPPDVLENLNDLRPGESAEHPFFVDSSPKYRELGSQKVMVFGLGRGGRAYYGLDITSKTAPTLLWRINNTTSGFSELGQSWSTPALGKFANGGSPIEVAVFGGGYDTHFDDPNEGDPNSTDPMGRAIFMVDLLTGAKRAQASPSGMTYAVPSDPLLFDVNGDQIFDRGYIGDMDGRMWRIDHNFTATRLFSTPEFRRIFYQPDAVINNGSVMVYFGTGDRSSPMHDGPDDRFYAVRDDGTNNLTETDLIDVTSNVQQPGSDGYETLRQQIDAKHGWFIRLGSNGEKVLAPPTVYFNVAFTTFTPSSAVCQAGGSAKIYVVDPLVGGPTLDLAGTSGGGLGGGEGTGGGVGSGAGGDLIAADRFVLIGQSIPTSLKVTFGDDETKAFLGVTKGGGIALQPLNLPQIATNVIPISWRQAWGW
ncbi:MAG: PilC/PilY family type IV pilus protein [Thermodesulfobacteriota bacterium]